MILLELAKIFGIVPAPLIDTFYSQIRSRALIEAQRVHLFDQLSKGPMTAAELASNLSYDSHGTEMLLEVLAVIGYVKKSSDGRYRNARWATKWLVANSSKSVGNIVMHAETVWERAPFIEPVLRTGKPPFDFHDETPPDKYHHYMLANRDMAKRLMPEFLKTVQVPATAKRSIDLGGAHGEFSGALVEANPQLKGTIFDLPPAILTGRQLAAEDKRLGRLTYQEGNFFEDDFGSGWDVVMLNHVARVFPPDRNKLLFDRVYQRLAPGGMFIITDHLLGFGKTHDMYGKLFSFNLYPVGGRCYEGRVFDEMLRAVGFASVTLNKLKSSIGSVIVIARKS